MPNPLVVADCCSLYSSILRYQPKSLGRCVKIPSCYLPDIQDFVAFSFIDDVVNLAEVSTKNAGSMQLAESFFKTGEFRMSFIGQKAYKQSRNTEKDEPIEGDEVIDNIK